MQPILANDLLNGVGALACDETVLSVCTDSREVATGTLFVCIQGERVDGHDFAAASLVAGAVGVVAQRLIDGVPPEKTVLVKDPLDALIAMAANYRNIYAPVLVGITGSVGKTTTKEFCYAVFSAFGKTLKTQGNQNNEIGTPNTLFRLDDSVQYAVIEMGMQGMGEIEKLTIAAKPCGAIITCIGVSHMEKLGSRANILKAKMEICDGMPDGAPLVLNGDDDLLPTYAVRAGIERVFFAINNQNADVVAHRLVATENGVRFAIEDKKFGNFAAFIPAIGEHNVRNALAAYTLATRLGLDAKIAAEALTNYKTVGHRQNFENHAGVIVIEDCYNASPDSMRAAIATLDSYPVKGRRIAVLGDMFELGKISEQAHKDVGSLVAANHVDMLITVGDAMHAAHARASALGVSCQHCANREDAAQLLLHTCSVDDVVLVKASHGMEFEKILEAFYAGPLQGQEEASAQ